MSYQVIARKYRPQKFFDVVGQDHITHTLQNAINAKRLHHAYLFTGVRGVGKTTLARIFSKALNCIDLQKTEPCNKCTSCTEITNGTSMDVQEIDGASNTGVDDVREIRERLKYLPSHSKYKIYIIDEVHMLSTAAFNALLKTLEEPPEHIIFIFATTEPYKIPATILSRCQRYNFRRIPALKIIATLSEIATSEGVEIDKDCLSIISREADGSMRDAESLFDQTVAFAGKKITHQHLQELLGFLDRGQIFSTIRSVAEKNAENVLSVSNELFQTGSNINRFLSELLYQFRNLIALKTKGKFTPESLDITEDNFRMLQEIAGKVTPEECQQWFNIIYRGIDDIARTKHPKVLLDVLLVRLTLVGPVYPVDELIEKLGEIEKTGGKKSVEPPATDLGKSFTMRAQDDTKKTFSSFIEWLRDNRPPLAAIIGNATEGHLDSSTLSVKFAPASSYADMLVEQDRKILTEKLAKDFFGRDIKINIMASESHKAIDTKEKRNILEEKRRQVKEETLQNEVVRETTNLFGAEVREIKINEFDSKTH